MIAKLLSNSTHTSAETAHVIPDWPYGRRLRCSKRIWIETKTNQGQRIVTQTSNPKRGNDWNNAPKASTYSEMCFFGENSEGMLECDSINIYSGPEKFAEFRKLPLDEGQLARLAICEKRSRIYNKESWAKWDASQVQVTHFIPVIA